MFGSPLYYAIEKLYSGMMREEMFYSIEQV